MEVIKGFTILWYLQVNYKQSQHSFYQVDEDVLHFNDHFFKSEIQNMFAEFDAEISDKEKVETMKCQIQKRQTRPRGYKTFFRLNSTELEISTANKN